MCVFVLFHIDYRVIEFKKYGAKPNKQNATKKKKIIIIKIFIKILINNNRLYKYANMGNKLYELHKYFATNTLMSGHIKKW